jgi:hypothetical protein
LTILIIAHRLTSIKSASNLLSIERRDKICSLRQGTPEYEEVMLRLKNITYACGEGEEEEVEQEKLQSLHASSILQRSLGGSKGSINQPLNDNPVDWPQQQYQAVPDAVPKQGHSSP